MTEARVDIEKVKELLNQMACAGVPWAVDPVEIAMPPVEKAVWDVSLHQYKLISRLAADEFTRLAMAELYSPASTDDEGDVATAAGAVWRAQARFMKAV